MIESEFLKSMIQIILDSVWNVSRSFYCRASGEKALYLTVPVATHSNVDWFWPYSIHFKANQSIYISLFLTRRVWSISCIDDEDDGESSDLLTPASGGFIHLKLCRLLGRFKCHEPRTNRECLKTPLGLLHLTFSFYHRAWVKNNNQRALLIVTLL